MKKLFPLFFLLPILGFAAECIRLPNGLYRLSNKYIQTDISANSGARCLSLINRRTGLEYTSPASDMGIGGECDWQERKMTASVWFGKPYSVLGTKDGDVAEIRCQRTGTGDIGQWITITKTYRLPEKSTEIEILYDIAVQAEAMKTISFFLWLHNSVQLKQESVKMLFPKENGINTIPFKPGAPINESFHYDMTDSWIAVARETNPSGVILQTPYEDLMCFYNWQGGEGNTIEQMFRQQKIQAGTSFKTSLQMTFYEDMPTIDGAGAGVAAQFTDKGIRIYSAFDDDAVVTISTRRPPELIEKPINEAPLKLTCADFGSIEGRWIQQNPGEELIVRIKTSRGTVVMRKPFDIKDYKQPPVAKRKGSDDDRYGMVLLNEDTCKDCYDWSAELPIVNGNPLLKPDANGRIRLLAVTDMIAGREVYEIAGRMDAEFSSCTFSTGGAIGWHPTWGHSGGIPETNLYLEQLLKKDYDAIIFGGQQFDTVTKKNMETIRAKVKAGTAFITVAPRIIPKEFEDLFAVKPTVDKGWGSSVRFPHAKSFKVADNSPIRNFPFKSLGFVPLFPCEPQLAAVICDNGQPFFASKSVGKGRVASFTWMNGIDDNTTRAGIMPYFADEPELPWHNVFYGMVIKATQDAISHAPKLEIIGFTASHNSLKVTVNNTLGRDIDSQCLLSVYQSNDMPETRNLPVKLAPGINAVSLPMDINCHAMLSLVELRLFAEGLAFDFAYDTIENPHGVTIEAEELPKRILLAGEPYTFKAKLTGKHDRAEAIIKDRHGRLLAQGHFNNEDNSVTLTPRGVVEHRAELTISLFAGEQKVGSRVFVIDLAPESELSRTWENYKVMLSWPVRDKRVLPFHLRYAWQDTLKDLGIDLVMSHGIPVGLWADNRAKYMLNYRYVAPLVMESITRLNREHGFSKILPYPQYDYRSRKKEVQNITENYGKTGDKSFLKRTPRLDDDEYIAAYKNAMDKWMPNILRWRPYMCDLGDEMSYGIFTSPLDFDFSPEGLDMFRKWLRQRYKDDLTKLNTEWKRDYKTWDEVMPDTGREATSRGVFSGWALHRLYNTTLFSNFWNVVATRARELDPGIRISASGTPPSHPYNGYDYEQLMPVVDTLIAYTRYGLAELIATFKKDAPIMSWVGYGTPESGVWKQIWDNAFNGHFGVGFYSEMTMLNPNLTLTRNGTWARDAVKSLHDGVGILLHYCESKPSALVHYSLPSLMVSGALQKYNSFNASYGIWIDLLKEHNCNPRFISPKGITRGDLLASGIKLLVLPNSTALSDAEIAAFKEFTDKGGIIIADMPPGQFNENVAAASTDRLKDIPIHVFGEPLVQDMTAPLMQKVQKKLDELFPQQSHVLSAKEGQPEIHTYSLCKEGGELFGIWPDRASEISLTSPDGYTVYDVIGRKAVSGDVNLRANRPGVFVALPYSVTGVDVNRSLNASNSLVVSAQVRASNGKPLRHALIFRVKDADGKELTYHRRTVNAPNGSVEVTIPLAISESAAQWTVEVTDVISGTTGK